MKTNTLILISLLIIILFNGLYFLYESKNNKTISTDSVQNIDYKDLYTIISDNLLYQIREDGITLENIDIYNENETRIPLGELSKNSKILVLRFSELNCDLCIIDQFNIIKDILDKDTKIIFLASYSNPGKLKAFLKAHNIDIPYYRVEEGALGMELENLNFPFYFILGENRQINQLFFPSKSLPQITEFYLNTLLQKGIIS